MAVHNQLDRVEARQDAIETAIEWSTCIGWAKQFKDRSLTLPQAAQFGKAATRRADELGVELSKIPDPRFGRVNVYPNGLLAEVWSEVFKPELCQ